MKYSGNIAGFDVKFELAPEDQGLDLALTTKYASGSAVASAAVSGMIYGLTNETRIIIEDHSLKEFTVKFLDVEGT